MGWDEPGNQKNPWGNKNQPPDLDEILKRLQIKLKNFFNGNKPSQSGLNSGGVSNNTASNGFVIGLAAIVAIILWALSGIFIVNPAEQAVILTFGKYSETVGPGPHWIPRIISTKIVRNVDRILDYSYSAQMLTKDKNLVAVAVAVQYRIGDLQDFLFNVADPEESLHQATSSALRQVIGLTTLDKIITEGREVWGASVQESLVNILSIYKTGIIIVNVSPQPARAPESVQDAFDDAIKAQEDEERFKEQARAYAARVIPVAMGNAKRIDEESTAHARQVKLRAEGEVAQFLALLPQYISAPEVTAERMYLTTMQKILTNTSKIIVDGKAGNMLYLPLDKIVSSTSHIPKIEIGEKDVLSKTTTGDDMRVSTRNSPRRSYNIGGNE
jgi:membrane protease subunit HflK